jgi:precorrin-6B methylase 2
LAPLGNLQALRFYALQKGSREEEAAAPPPGFTVQNLGPELRDFGETAAAISQLDLVLSVDTSVAHLAGAMGKPVWLMLPKAADWRWLEHREESPWYPTMRLFRQRVQGEWSEVVERVGATLHALRNGGKSLPAANVVAPVELVPTVARSTHITGQLAAMSAVAETRMGALQYLPDEPLVGDSLRWYGELLQPQLDLLVPMVRPASTVLEVGAGVGAHALALAVAAGDEGHLILYESNPVARRILRKNLDVNRVGNVTLMRWTCSAGASAQPSLESLDELQLDRLHLLKVNDAAAVTDVLTGAVATLWRLRPLLFLAVEDESALTGTAVRIRECGYRCWRVETPWFNPRNFNRRDDDMFAGRAALALLAIPEESDTGVAQSGFVELS